MIIAIVAMTKDRVIGINNSLPWQNKEDLQHFKETTLNNAIVMGRKTFESLKLPLPNRTNIVVSNNKDYKVPSGVVLESSLKKIIQDYRDNNKNLFVIGGANIYEQCLPYCDKLIISIIPGEYKGDVYFPNFEEDFEFSHKEQKETFEVYHYLRKKTYA